MASSRSIEEYRFHTSLRQRHKAFGGFGFEFASSVMHRHLDFYEIILVTSGEWQHTYNDSTTTLPAGTLCLFKPGATHQLLTEPLKSTHFVMCVEQNYFKERIGALFPKFDLEGSAAFLSKTIHKDTSRYIEYLGTNIYKALSPNLLMAEEILYLCMSEFATEDHSLDYADYVTDIIKKLNNLLYMNIPAQEIYSHYPCSHSVLLRHFKQVTGMTLVQYRTMKKLEYACELLTATDTTTPSIAAALQYDSVSCFFRTFKQHFGMTPAEYRDKHRNQTR